MASLSVIRAVAKKEFLHVLNDRRILGLILFLPPIFTLLLGHAFEVGALSNVPATLLDRDQSPESKAFVERLRGNQAFAWKLWSEGVENAVAKRNLAAALIIPKNWGVGLYNGDPQPVELFADGADTNTAPEIEGNLQTALAKFQMDSRETLIDNLPDEVFDFGRKLSPEVRHEFVSTMTPWEVKTTTLYNPDLKFVHFAMPGIVGLILQLMTVTFTAAGLAKEKESGSFARLQVAPINKFEIVVGKILPYLVIASVIGTMLFILGAVHFHVGCGQPSHLVLAGLLFLLSSAGLGVLTASMSQTQTQAIQISVLFLLPVFLLAGAFAPLSQLPLGVRLFSYLFPLTYFCDACRQINLYGGDFLSVLPDLIMLTIGGAMTCCLAAWRLRGSDLLSSEPCGRGAPIRSYALDEKSYVRSFVQKSIPDCPMHNQMIDRNKQPIIKGWHGICSRTNRRRFNLAKL